MDKKEGEVKTFWLKKIKLNNHGGTLDLIFEHISYFYEMMVQLLKCYQSVLSETQIDALKCCVI